MTLSLATIVESALDRAVAEPSNARPQLAFAGAVDAVDAEAGKLPLPVLVSMAAVPTVQQAVAENSEALVRGAALAVRHRNLTVGEVAAMADLPASVVHDAVESGRCRSSRTE